MFTTTLDRFAMAPILVPIAKTLRTPVSAIVGTAAIYYLVYGLMQPVWGLLSDRFGRLTVMRIGLAGAAAAGVASTLVPDLASLLVARALAGAFFAAVFPASLVYVGDAFPLARRQAVIADLLAATAIGTGAGSLGAGLLAQYTTWRLAFALPAVLAAVLTILLRRVAEPSRAASGMAVRARLGVVLRNRWAVYVITLAFGQGAIMFGFLTYFAPALESHGVTAGLAGFVVASYGLSVLLLTQALKQLVGRTGPLPLMAAGGLATVAGYGLAALNQREVSVLAASALVGAGFALLHSSIQTWATDVTPVARGTAVAFFAGAAFVGGALSTAAVADLAARGNYRGLFLTAAGLAVVVTLVATVGRWRYRPAGAVSSPGAGVTLPRTST
ncbi:MAG: MFS transporter [Candidatus Dormibacteraeota bacterium]|nr:MFS transporter [Candidatus Dormibacteraeota bacterium]